MRIAAALADRSDNEDLLRQVYDPGHVRHVRLIGSAAPVQVCLDARMLGTRGTGVATYAEVLARCLPYASAAPVLLRQSPADEQLPERSKLGRWASALDGRTPRDAHQIERDDGAPGDLTRADVFREAQVFFNIHRRPMPVVCDAPPPVMHWTYPVPLFLKGSRNLYTVHDAIPLIHPSLTPIRQSRHDLLLRRIADHAHRIVTVSESARADILATLGLEAHRVVSLSQAIDMPLQRDPVLPPGLRTGRYFLFCGTIEPRKNLVALAEAHQASGTAMPLVIVGPDGWRARAVHARLSAFADVIVLPWQERPVLIGLMRRARALLLPSLAEGFGLPIAEAMTLGTPVLTADLPATAEVAGGAALLADPLSVADLARGVSQLADDGDLITQLRARGFARAAHFTLDAYARRLRDFYAEVARGVVTTGAAR